MYITYLWWFEGWFIFVWPTTLPWDDNDLDWGDRSIKEWDMFSLTNTMHTLHVHGDWIQSLCMSRGRNGRDSAVELMRTKTWIAMMQIDFLGTLHWFCWKIPYMGSIWKGRVPVPKFKAFLVGFFQSWSLVIRAFGVNSSWLRYRCGITYGGVLK